MHRLDTFYPNSYNYWRYPHLTFENANTFPTELLELVSYAGSAGEQVEEHTPTSFSSGNNDGDALSRLLSQHGSDKSSVHDYHFVYAELLAQLGREAELKVLEIGIGTNDPSIPSSMGKRATPGASVRAFRDFLPNSSIYGADIDRAILFREDRIVTTRVDQLDRTSFTAMADTFDCHEFDVIIDDGLHSVEANANTLRFALGALRKGGWFVVEDIPDRTLDVWRLVGRLIANENRSCHLVRCQKANLFLVNLRS